MLRIHAVSAALCALALAAPALAAPPIEAYGKLPAIEHVSLSPSGQRYAMIAVVGDTRKMVALTSDGSKPVVAGEIGAAKVRSVEWAGEDHLLVTVSKTVNIGYDFTVPVHELSSVIAVNVVTQKSFAVFADSRATATAVMGKFGAAEVDGHPYGYFGTITYAQDKTGDRLDHTYPDLYRVDLDTGKFSLLAKGGENIEDWLVSPAGVVVARSWYADRSGDWKVTLGDFGGKALASGRSPLGGADLVRLGRTPDTLLIEHPGPDGDVYEETPLSGAAATPAPESSRIESPLFDRRTGLWIGDEMSGDTPSFSLFDPLVAAKVRGTLKAFPGLSVELVSWSDDFNRLIVFTSGSGDAGTYWMVDIATRNADPIGEAYPDVRPADVGPIRMVDWKAADGLALRGVLSLPPGRDAKALPLIVMPHGGPESRDYPVFDWWAQAFVSRGYAVFQPNFRGSSGYGLAFRDAGFGQWGRKMQTDISDGVAELARQGIVDPKRVCIVGASYGGYAALAGVTLQHGLYRCSVSVAGVADPEAMLNYARDESGYASAVTRYWRDFMGVTGSSDAGVSAISPVRRAAQADAPILLIHGKDDTVVPIEESFSMEKALKAAGKPVELVVMKGEDHWLSSGATRLTMLESSVAFVEKHNPPDAAR